MKLSQRQIDILKIIVERYISNATPISSKEIQCYFPNDISSATIRNEMGILENNAMIEKTHTSSGRVPTIAGYKFYEENILKPLVSKDMKTKLNRIFAKRLTSIDSIISESVALINETMHLPSVVTTIQEKESLKRIDLIPINKNIAIILIVSSSGEVVKNTISFDTDKILMDISTCIRIFNDRLINTPFDSIMDKVESIKEIIRQQVENYEFVMQEVIIKLFDFESHSKSSVRGTKWLTQQPEFQDREKMQNLLNMLEDTNIWNQISYLQEQNGNTTIIHGEQLGFKDLSLACATITGIDNNKHQISVVGPNRMDYAKIKGILDYIKNELEKKYHD